MKLKVKVYVGYGDKDMVTEKVLECGEHPTEDSIQETVVEDFMSTYEVEVLDWEEATP